MIRWTFHPHKTAKAVATKHVFLQCSPDPLAGLKGAASRHGRGREGRREEMKVREGKRRDRREERERRGGKRMGEGNGCLMAVWGWMPMVVTHSIAYLSVK